MYLKNIILGLTLLILLITKSTAIENKILFKVNNEIITSLDILNELRYLKAINEQFENTENKQAFEIAKRSIIREKIKEIELKKVVKSIELKDQYLNNVLINYFKKIQINSIVDFENYFTSINIDPDLIKKKITIEVLWNEYIFSKYNQNVKIDKQSIVKNLKKSEKQKEFLLSEILFNVNKNEKLLEKYNLIKNEIQNTNFSNAALIYSISDTANKGGTLGWIKESSMSKKIRTTLRNINIGNYSDPIIIPGGFLILKVKDTRQTSVTFDLDKEVERVIKEKTNEQLNQFSNILFNKIQRNVTINEF